MRTKRKHPRRSNGKRQAATSAYAGEHAFRARRLVNAQTLAEYLSVPKKTLYQWAAVGELPALRVGRRVRFDLDDIDRWIERRKADSSSDTASTKGGSRG